MMYGCWDMEHDRHNFLLFWTIFCSFTHLWTQKIKILKKWKNCMEKLSFYTGTHSTDSPTDIIILHMCTINDNYMIIWCMVFWDMECDRENFFVILDRFLAFYAPNNPKNQNFEKIKKVPGDIIMLHMFT